LIYIQDEERKGKRKGEERKGKQGRFWEPRFIAYGAKVGRYRAEMPLSVLVLGDGKRFKSTLAFMGRCNHQNRWSHHRYSHAHQRMDIRTEALAPNACPVTMR